MNTPTKKYSNKHEKDTAKSLQGKVVGGSGCGSWLKGDVVTEHCLIECKTTMSHKQSYTAKKEVLQKLKEEAFAMRKPIHALAFNFGPEQPNYYVVDSSTFLNLLECYNEINKSNT